MGNSNVGVWIMILSLYICTLIDGGRIAELRARIAKLEAVAPHLEVGVKP